NILLLGLPVDIYTLINHYQTAKELWDRVKELMEGIEMTKQERESMLHDEFEKFTYETRESIHSYYLRYAKLINDMNMIPMSITQATIQNGQVTVHNVQGRQSQGYAGNAGKNQASGARVFNIVRNAWANQPRAIRCYNFNSEGHIAKQCSAKKRVKDSEWFKDKMLLAQAQEARVVLNEEQHDFLADSLEETDDYSITDSLKENDECEDLQLQATINFKAYHVDAYDLDCNDEATANAIFKENMSPVGSINCDIVAPRYDSDILSEVPHHDTIMNSNVISYADYMVTIGNNDDNYVPSPVQKNDMILFVIEPMKSQVEKCNT
nr:integrase, catalytic region, zinc finger, CCHC-type, peptidase aspartic, catalytic [Tanacetum cinerariifolium]GFA55620.1 integrase, catalytic region, zinc finger, CCHC-type, peptidase aspartic, catalytic [Tanacetum cinerariifolium]